MTEKEVKNAIKGFCSSSKSRQREDLYKYLNEKLSLNLEVYDYNGTNDHARFACDEESQQHETDYIMDKLINQVEGIFNEF